ncbi:MAG: reverse transcriptase domain-containing protein, partial [Lactobacillaceae bacterium]
NGFNQLLISNESKKYTAFMILGHQYQYKRVPFGIKLGPKVFQRNISEILYDIPNCFVYIDDIVVFTKSEKEHIEVLGAVLKRLYRHSVRINFDKSNFLQKEINVLGYRVNKNGIYPQTKCLKNVIVNKEYKTKKDVQKLMGIINWYRKFIPNISTKMAQISDLLKKDEKRHRLSNEMKNKSKK